MRLHTHSAVKTQKFQKYSKAFSLLFNSLKKRGEFKQWNHHHFN